MTHSAKTPEKPKILCTWPDKIALICHATLLESPYASPFVRFLNQHPDQLKLYFEYWLQSIETARYYIDMFHLVLSDQSSDNALEKIHTSASLDKPKWKIHKLPVKSPVWQNPPIFSVLNQSFLPDAFGCYNAALLEQFLDTENIRTFLITNFSSHFLIPGYFFENLLELFSPHKAHVIQTHPKIPPLWISTTSVFQHVYYEVKSEHHQVLDSQFNRKLEHYTSLPEHQISKVNKYKQTFIQSKKNPLILQQLVKKVSRQTFFNNPLLNPPCLRLNELINHSPVFHPLPPFAIPGNEHALSKPHHPQWKDFILTLAGYHKQHMPLVADVTGSDHKSLLANDLKLFLTRTSLKPVWIQLGLFYNPLQHLDVHSIILQFKQTHPCPIGICIPLTHILRDTDVSALQHLDFVILNLDPLVSEHEFAKDLNDTLFKTINSISEKIPSHVKLILRISFKFQYISLIEKLFSLYHFKVNDIHVKPHTDSLKTLQFKVLNSSSPSAHAPCLHARHIIFLNSQLEAQLCDAPHAIHETYPDAENAHPQKGVTKSCHHCQWKTWNNHLLDTSAMFKHSVDHLASDTFIDELQTWLNQNFNASEYNSEYSLQWYQAAVRDAFFQNKSNDLLSLLDAVLQKNPLQEPFKTFLQQLT